MDASLLSLLSKTPTLQDAVKLIYQRAFAGGHMIDDPDASFERLCAELDGLEPQDGPPADGEPLFVPIGNGLCRLSLWALRQLEREGAAPTRRTVNGLFVHTAAGHKGDPVLFQSLLAELPHLCETGTLPWDPQDVRRWLADYQRKGSPALHHSAEYRTACHPAYRVVTADASLYWPVFLAMDRLLAERPQAVAAIDGGSGSGKSHLAGLLQAVYSCNLVHMDDFFLQTHQRTPERLAEPGGNLDRERVQREVIDRLDSTQESSYQRYSCQLGELTDWVPLLPGRPTLLEGVYSMHPLWQDRLDLRIFLRTSTRTQRERILHRNGEWMLQRFLTEWIPLENQYFAAYFIEANSDLVLETDQPAACANG